MSRQFDFLESFIHNVLDESGFEDLPESTRAQLVPMFIAEAERRLGLALLPLLDDAQAKKLVDLGNSEETSSEDLNAFWQSSVPNFQNVVQSTLNDFAEEFKKNLANIQK